MLLSICSSSAFAKNNCISIGLGGFIPSQNSVDVSNGTSDLSNGGTFLIDYEYKNTKNVAILFGIEGNSSKSKDILINTQTGELGKIEYGYSAFYGAVKYIFNPDDSFKLFGIGGLAYSDLEIEFTNIKGSESVIGLYIGGGIEKMLGDSVKLGAQIDHRTGSKDGIKMGGTGISLKIGYCF